MGIDAVMMFRVPGGISDEDLRKADWDLPATIGSENFWTSSKDNICLSTADDGWIDISLSGRLYAEGYERGQLLEYLAIADWLERRFPGVEIRYGGDTGAELVNFNKEYRDKLYNYWLDNGCQPYERCLSDEHENEKGCDRCVKPLVYYGGNLEKSFFHCLACGDEFTREGEKLTKDDD